jgi:hypothetical protein
VFAADAEGYKYIVWGFNGRFAISSPKPRQNASFSWAQVFSTVRILSSIVDRAEEILIRAKKPPFEHAQASAAPAASSKSRFHSLAGSPDRFFSLASLAPMPVANPERKRRAGVVWV